jgi:hypothetical protein
MGRNGPASTAPDHGIVFRMSAIPWHRPQNRRPTNEPDAAAGEAFDFRWDDLPADTTDRIDTQRADCCVASAAYRVLLPATPSRNQPSELLLCSHHYHSSQATLVHTRVRVFDARNRPVATGQHA